MTATVPLEPGQRQLRTDRPPRARPRSPGLAFAFLALAALGLPAASETAQTAPDSVAGTLRAWGAAELARLDRFENSPRSSKELLVRNLSRYHVRYLVPSNSDELSRLLGTLERMTRAAGTQLLEASAALAKSSGSRAIGHAHVAAVLSQALPAKASEYDELVFFPQAPPAQRAIVERIDVQALRDTGLAAEILVAIADEAVAVESDLVLEPEAASILAEGLTSYALLLLRLGGLSARLEYAEHLFSKHLRAAGKAIAAGAAPADPLHPSVHQAVQRSPASDPAGAPLFIDVTATSKLGFRHQSTEWISAFRRYGRIAPTFSGGGVAVGNINQDALADLIFCGGRGCRLYLGRGDGTFEDATVAAGINIPGEARMAILADFDNDGDHDLFLTYARDTNRIFRNRGNGTFADVTTKSGLWREGDISGPACAVDVDNDGLLDIYVGNFGNYLAGRRPASTNQSVNGQPNRLYRNLGDLVFEEISEAAGVGDTGWAQAISHVDADRDGDQDLYVANDFGANELFLNRGAGIFDKGGESTGSDDNFHGMNVSFTDLNRDGYADVFVTNIWFQTSVNQEITETNTVLVSQPGPDGIGYERRFGGPEFLTHDTGWSWGAVFLDAENDGDDDLFVVNGFTDYLTFIQYRPHPRIPGLLYPINNGRDANSFFRNDSGFATERIANSGLEMPGYNSRAVVAFDLDGDHDLDLAVTTFHDRARLFRNVATSESAAWLEVELEGDPGQGVNRDAIGAQLVFRGDDDLHVYRAVTGGEGYLSMSAMPTLVGLGSARTVDLEILWPNGEIQTLDDVDVNQRLRIVQPREKP